MLTNALLASIIVCFLSDFSYGQKSEEFLLNDYTYIEAINSSYKIHPTPQTWFDAKRECAQEGASLFYAENDDEQNAVMSFRNETQPYIKWVFVGISDLVSEGVFKTIDGKAISEVYKNWKIDEPNDKNGDEDCVEQDNAGKMNDCKCSRKLSFICKKGPVSNEESNSDSNRNNTNKDGQTTEEFLLNDYTYIEAINSSYKIHPTPQTWIDAKRECAQEGASLFYAENDDEQNAVMSFRKETQPDMTWVFVGISDLVSEGVFETIDGKASSEVYNNWKIDEPNDKNGDADCVEQDNAGKMNDCKCSRKLPFICKKGPVSNEESNSDSNRNNTNKDGQTTEEFLLNDYTYIEAINSSYKIHLTPQTWIDAKRECAHEEASLFYAENDDEQNAVMSFRSKTQPDIMWVFVGISDLSTEGVFETIDGKTISEVYSNWKIDEPNDKNGDEDCVEQDNAGKMNDCKCSRKLPFICKKGPVSHGDSNSDSNRNNTNKDGQRSEEFLLNDYTCIKAINSSYKIHPTPQTWIDAKRECAQEGASLFYAENEDEQNAVMSFRNETQPDMTWVFVGISDLVSEGVFETIDGKAISEVYSNWKIDEPNDKNGDEDCVEQDNAGKMNDCKCSRKLPFICKKGPVSHGDSNSDSNRNNTNKDGQRSEEFLLNDYTYIKAINSSYKIHPTPQTWIDAKRECAQEGASLFYAENDDEQNAVMSFRNETQRDMTWDFVGISDLVSEGVFETIDGKAISEVYSNWKIDEPNDKNGDEDCVEQDNAGKMNDCKCSRKLPFICKKGPVSHGESKSDSNRNNTNKDGQRTEKFLLNDYTYIEAVNSSYKIHPTPQTWIDAKRECAQEGASLFYAENNDEQNAVMSFQSETQPDIMWVFVGISDLASEGVFETIDGKASSEVYNNWKIDEPNDKNGDEDCVEQDNAGKMNDCKCSRKLPFICKKGPVSHEDSNSDSNRNNTNKDGQRSEEFLLNDYTYIKAINSSYKIHPTPQTWIDAKRDCAQEGASLFYAENDDEQNAVMSFRNETQPDMTWVFVGISDLVSEGVFETIDGKAISEVYSNWKIDEPNDKNGDEDCVEQDNAGKMNDCKCSRKLPFICKKGPVSHGESNSDSNRNNTNKDRQRTEEFLLNNYTYIEAVNSFYKIHPAPQTWFDAKRECAQEGANLFYAENDDEQNAVISFQSETQPDIMWVFVGISDLASEGVFETIDGKAISEVYNNWKLYEPNDKNDEEDCVEQDKAGKMNDNKCSRKFPFICKKSPLSLEQNNGVSNSNDEDELSEMRELEDMFTPEEWESFFEELDVDHSGTIEDDEFPKIMSIGD